MTRKLIAITPGEPAGVGPELLLQLVASDSLNTVNGVGSSITPIAVANAELMRQRAAALGIDIDIVATPVSKLADLTTDNPGDRHSRLHIVDIDGYHNCMPGEPNIDNAGYLLKTLDTAIELCQRSIVHAMVTGPINKHSVNQGLEKNDASNAFFSGHTEYLAEQTHCEKVVMMLAGKASVAKNNQLRVALATTHLPLHKVASEISPVLLEQVLRILHNDLQKRFGLTAPRILVCGLNPHAGEQGDLGVEELNIIDPTLNRLRQQGLDVSNSLPADTLFTPHHLQQADAVLAMYHDQGLPVLKSHSFGNAANITLGLPFIRTSVDHGTAFDLAGTGNADLGSLRTAIKVAVDMQ